jgi:hypothetical protein
MRSPRFILAGFLAAVLAVTPAAAKVAPTTLAQLTAGSSSIVVGKVTSVFEIRGVRVATLSVEETWKGPQLHELAFLAQGTWTCDIADADPGERALLFLVPYQFDPEPNPKPRDPNVWSSDFKEPAGFRQGLDHLGLPSPFMAIFWSGRGRMPTRLVDGQEHVTLWTDDVRLPPSISTVDGPEREYAGFIRSARLEAIREEVIRAMGRRK